MPRQPAGLVARGTHVCTLPVVTGTKYGLAVSPDEKHMVVGLHGGDSTLTVYALPGGEVVRTFGRDGSGQLQFSRLFRMCFIANGHLLVDDYANNRLQEVTVEGAWVRYIGTGIWDDGFPFSLTVHEDKVAVAKACGTANKVVMLSLATGKVTKKWGAAGKEPGQLGDKCEGIRFSPDGSLLVIAERDEKRASMFTCEGVFVRCIGVGVLGGYSVDVDFTSAGEVVVADMEHNCIRVFSPDGAVLVRSFGTRGALDGQFSYPTALAVAGTHLYVLEFGQSRVQVFE